MITSFLAVSQQVLVLFFLIAAGFICSKKGIFSKESIGPIATFLLYIVTPCVIIESFNRPFDSKMLNSLGIAALAALGVHLMNILIVTIAFRSKNRLGENLDEKRWRVLRFATVFSNCGYMALPLQSALLGSDGVFFGAAYIAVFNIVNWTYGLFLIGGSSVKLSIKKLIINPGVIGVAIGLILFLSPLKFPTVISSAVHHLAAMNTSLPMVIIGYYLASIVSFNVLKDKQFCLSLFLRLIFSPACALIILYALGLRGVLLISVIVAASAPTAANTVMFSVLHNRDSELAVKLVSVSTLFSIITMPIVVSVAMLLG